VFCPPFRRAQRSCFYSLVRNSQRRKEPESSPPTSHIPLRPMYCLWDVRHLLNVDDATSTPPSVFPFSIPYVSQVMHRSQLGFSPNIPLLTACSSPSLTPPLLGIFAVRSNLFCDNRLKSPLFAPYSYSRWVPLRSRAPTQGGKTIFLPSVVPFGFASSTNLEFFSASWA